MIIFDKWIRLSLPRHASFNFNVLTEFRLAFKTLSILLSSDSSKRIWLRSISKISSEDFRASIINCMEGLEGQIPLNLKTPWSNSLENKKNGHVINHGVYTLTGGLLLAITLLEQLFKVACCGLVSDSAWTLPFSFCQKAHDLKDSAGIWITGRLG